MPPRKIFKCTVSQVASQEYLCQTQAFKSRYFIHSKAMVIKLTVSQTSRSYPGMREGGVFFFYYAARAVLKGPILAFSYRANKRLIL